MGITSWNDETDEYNYEQLDNNWQIVDTHDHSPGKGVQIPEGGIANGAIGTEQLSSAVPTIQTGTIVLWPTSTVPTGYLACDGSEYLETAYAGLYTVLGSTYNNSPPGGYFNVPLLSFSAPGYDTLIFIIKA